MRILKLNWKIVIIIITKIEKTIKSYHINEVWFAIISKGITRRKCRDLIQRYVLKSRNWKWNFHHTTSLIVSLDIFMRKNS